ncbi:hypothetical protein O6H91_06G035900 [Diphasiastrum complanatum]|uniref:Uncharacterized protein n=1 Tax=Diphasiastrum complanatum TaxID=34168 RepID=A0ACC2DCG7_DIPCM|nr:hypothetical protein O6H91_06G035900 [Diphasiastrum complanatum]
MQCFYFDALKPTSLCTDEIFYRFLLIKMETVSVSKIVYTSLLFSLLAATASVNGGNELNFQTYIVRMDKSFMPSSFASHSHWYASTLASTIGAESNGRLKDSFLHVYNVAFEGFAARMTVDQAKALEKLPGFGNTILFTTVFQKTKSEISENGIRSTKLLHLAEILRPGRKRLV